MERLKIAARTEELESDKIELDVLEVDNIGLQSLEPEATLSRESPPLCE